MGEAARASGRACRAHLSMRSGVDSISVEPDARIRVAREPARFAEAILTAFVYRLRCSDGSDYVGSARGESLDKRLADHQTGTHVGYTYHRRPVTLVYAEWFDRITDAIAAERRIEGWSRAKKEALIAKDGDRVQFLAKRPSARINSSDQPPHPELPRSGLEGSSRYHDEAGSSAFSASASDARHTRPPPRETPRPSARGRRSAGRPPPGPARAGRCG